VQSAIEENYEKCIKELRTLHKRIFNTAIKFVLKVVTEEIQEK